MGRAKVFQQYANSRAKIQEAAIVTGAAFPPADLPEAD
jgi:hypothetical protein